MARRTAASKTDIPSIVEAPAKAKKTRAAKKPIPARGNYITIASGHVCAAGYVRTDLHADTEWRIAYETLKSMYGDRVSGNMLYFSPQDESSANEVYDALIDKLSAIPNNPCEVQAEPHLFKIAKKAAKELLEGIDGDETTLRETFSFGAPRPRKIPLPKIDDDEPTEARAAKPAAKKRATAAAKPKPELPPAKIVNGIRVTSSALNRLQLADEDDEKEDIADLVEQGDDEEEYQSIEDVEEDDDTVLERVAADHPQQSNGIVRRNGLHPMMLDDLIAQQESQQQQPAPHAKQTRRVTRTT